jgi:hypothetical protein
MSTGTASLSVPQLVALLDQFHIALAFTIIGILATVSVCVSFFFRTISEGVLAFYECLARCAEARERFRRTRTDHRQCPNPKKTQIVCQASGGCPDNSGLTP